MQHFILTKHGGYADAEEHRVEHELPQLVHLHLKITTAKEQ